MFRRAAMLLPLVRASLRLRGYQKTYGWLQARLARGTPAMADNAGASEPLNRIWRMLRAASHYIPLKFTCLEESLALWYLLGQQGISSRLRIGVRKTSGKFEAHAWVEHQGEALNQPEELHRHYAAFEKEFSEPPVEQA